MERYQALVNRLLDVIFPPRCVACSRYGEWLCGDCLGNIELAKNSSSRGASLRGRNGVTDVAILQDLVALGYYHDPRLRSVIHALKYRYGRCLLPKLEVLLRRMAEERRDPWPWAGEHDLAVQAVIGSPSQISKRGFDQAELISALVRKNVVTWAKQVSLLRRSNSLCPQVEIDDVELRQSNVKNVFHLDKCPPQIPEAVLLVDDVYTSGATMQSAAQTLQQAGVKRIYGFVLALGK